MAEDATRMNGPGLAVYRVLESAAFGGRVVAGARGGAA